MEQTKNDSKSFIDDELIHSSSELLRAITHPLRLSIIQFIDKEGETTVKKIYRSLELEQSITSQHLKILRDTDLVNTKKIGKHIVYSLNYNKLSHIIETLQKYIN